MLVFGADERGGASSASSAETPNELAIASTMPDGVVGDVHEAESVWISRSSKPVAGRVAQPRELLVGRRGRQRLRGVAASSPSPERRLALMPTICASRAASARIFGPPPPITNGGSGAAPAWACPSSSVIR